MRKLPSNVAELRGYYKAHPERRPAPKLPGPPDTRSAPTAAPLSVEPPAHLAFDVACTWRELVGSAVPGALLASDAVAVEMAAVLLVEFRRFGAACDMAMVNRLFALLRALGLTPLGRSDVARGLPPPKQENEFGEFAGRK